MGRVLRHLSALDDKAAVDALEVEVAGDLCVEQDLDQVPVSHNKLGDEVDVEVTVLCVAQAREELSPRVTILARLVHSTKNGVIGKF